MIHTGNILDVFFGLDPSKWEVELTDSEFPEIVDVIFNNPATIVFWDDGTKTIVKCQKGDTYSKETGLAMAIVKKIYGNKGRYNDVFAKWIPSEKDV